LATSAALLEFGKIRHHSDSCEFTLPTSYFFAARRGLGRDLEKLVFSPSALRKALIDRWDAFYAGKIVRGRADRAVQQQTRDGASSTFVHLASLTDLRQFVVVKNVDPPSNLTSIANMFLVVGLVDG
jgi:hypothetical protein